MKPAEFIGVAIGLTLSASAAAQSAPHPTADVAEYLGSDNYPPAALRVGAQG